MPTLSFCFVCITHRQIHIIYIDRKGEKEREKREGKGVLLLFSVAVSVSQKLSERIN